MTNGSGVTRGAGEAAGREIWLVTGGAGFIGSHLVDALIEEGLGVRVFDNFSSGRRENLEPAQEAARRKGVPFEIVEGDLRNDADVKAAVRGTKVVFHEAALGSVERSVQDPLTSNEVNVTGTLRVLVAAREAGVRRVLFAGSSSIYGDLDLLPKTEAMPARPISPYGLTKLAGEQYMRIFARIYGLETVTLRYFNVFGPRQDENSIYAAVIPLFISRLTRGEPPQVNGDGETSRDFTFVENVVRANLLAARAPAAKVSGQIINIACGSRHSLNAMLATLRRLTGRDIASEHRDERVGDVRHSQADITLARELLGFEPTVSFDEGLARTVAWFNASRRAAV